MEFDDFYWHDSIIRKIETDRTAPRENDTVLLDIDWYDTGVSKLLFEDVYHLEMNMNFGMIVNKSIFDAYMLPKDDPYIVQFKEL